ncbi:MAG: DEAD/DEAH box helicase [Alphaproteobacteria bacterium]|nr:DEAD/DEAH box helicase [Alphaproteobacteria bacterium]
MNFADLGLSEKTIKAVSESGIIAPTTVQTDVIPSVLAGKDVFTIAPSGCGKTCSYVLPLIDIISNKKAKNILIITAGPQQSVVVSDRFAVFNKYHEIREGDLAESQEDIDDEANVVIASPNLLSDMLEEDKIDLTKTDILVVDDINLIKKTHQLENLQKVLKVLPADKQNIVYTNRRSKETQEILDQILQTPEEIKIDRNKEKEALHNDTGETAVRRPVKQPVEEVLPIQEIVKTPKESKKKTIKRESLKDAQAMELVKKYHTFGRNTPAFLLTEVKLAEDSQ